jgi:Glycosyl transferase family 2
MTPLRFFGLLLAAAILVAAWALARRGRARNADVLMLLVAGLGLLIVSTTDLADAALRFFDFHKGGGGRILGLTVFALIVLLLVTLRLVSVTARNAEQLSAVVEGLAAEQFHHAGHGARFENKIAVLIPAYEEADNLADVLPRVPKSVCGVEMAILVLDDGSRDDTARVAAREGAVVARHVTNRGGGAALRTGYRLMVESDARIVVTLDADGQHRPEEIERLVEPVLSGQVDLAHGSRILGHAEPGAFARELGISFFNRLVSFMTRTHVTDCSNGFRAVRTGVLPQLVLRQQQFHTSEFVIESIKRGVPAIEVPITVDARLHGKSKKPAVVRYGLGFANAIVRTWLR